MKVLSTNIVEISAIKEVNFAYLRWGVVILSLPG